jgi:Domain of unknown function (DUF4375)
MSDMDYRAEISAAAFDAIPADAEDPIDRLYEALIDRNKRINHRFFDDTTKLQKLTRGQRLLLLLGTFDSQVKNGGITQFFWNCPEAIFDVADAIESLGVADLQANYERALQGLLGSKDRWLALKGEWAKAKDNPSWEAFKQTYKLLDLGWFDKAYFDQRGYNDSKEWVLLRRGLHHVLLTRLAKYVRTHRAEFIVE